MNDPFLDNIDENLNLPEETEESQDELQELYEHHHFIVDKGQSLLRIDKFLSDKLMNVSRNKIQNAAVANTIIVNGKPIKANYRVKPLDEISVLLPYPKRDYEILPENIPLDIVYEDDDVLLINKQAGLVVHPGVGNFTGTLLNALKFYFQETKQDAEGLLVHRIDKNTSGLLLVAKNEVAQTFLAKQFFDHSIERKYYALVWGDFDEDEGTIVGNIGRSLKDRRVMTVFPDGEQGKHAVTHYKVVERFGYVTLIECKLETGRTHQIRAHLTYMRHPLFNDAAYTGDQIWKGTTFSKYKQFIQNCFTILPRQALHAATLGFIRPKTKKNIHFNCPFPQDMETLLEKWRKYTNN